MTAAAAEAAACLQLGDVIHPIKDEWAANAVSHQRHPACRPQQGQQRGYKRLHHSSRINDVRQQQQVLCVALRRRQLRQVKPVKRLAAARCRQSVVLRAALHVLHHHRFVVSQQH
jgi:hypothetical protein